MILNSKTLTLEELVNITSSKRIYSSDYVKEGIPFYRSKEIIEKSKGNKITTELYISFDKYCEIKSKFGTPNKGDLLITSVGTLGVPFIVDSDNDFYFKDGNLIWFKDFNENLNPSYLYYWLLSNNGKEELEKHTIGSTQKAFTIQGLKKIKIDLPNIETQINIAKILSDLDRKIEINRRMNEVLEQISQALFQKYFIDNPESIKWESASLGSLITPRRGASLLRKDMKEGRVPVVSGGLEPSGYSDKSNTTAPVVTVSASGANAGYVRLWHDNVWSADSCFIDLSISKYVYFFYIFLKLKQAEIYSMQTGAAQPHIYPSHLERLDIKHIPQERIIEFSGLVEPLFKKIGAIEFETRNLADLRNLLLPKLISGRIQV